MGTSYPQGEKRRAASPSFSISSTASSFPWIHARAASGSFFGTCPAPRRDLIRLKANSTCQRARYSSRTSEAGVPDPSVVKTMMYPAASSVSGRTCFCFFRAERVSFSLLCLAASALFRIATTRAA